MRVRARIPAQAIERWEDKNRAMHTDPSSNNPVRLHQWEVHRTVIGIIFECTVCRTWMRKKNNRSCPGKEYK